MSGALFTYQLGRETGVELTEERLENRRQAHARANERMGGGIRPLPGARELLDWLTKAGIPWVIATSGRMETASVNPRSLGVDPDKSPVVTRDQVKYAKPDPDLFVAAAQRLGAPIDTAVVVGDSIWDLLAAARSASACSAAAMVRTNCSRPPRSGFTGTRPICWSPSTRWEGEGRVCTDSPADGAGPRLS